MTEKDSKVSGHAAFAELLAGFVDDELSSDELQRVEAHLADCAACRAELRGQTVIRSRLMKESISSGSAGLAERVLAQIEDVQSTAATPATTTRRQWLITWGGWAAAAAMGGVSVWFARKSPTGMTPDPKAGPVTLDQVPGAVPTDILASFREINEEELPVGADLAALRRQLDFSIPALEAPHMRLISAWVTRVKGEPAAALAYRCHDRLVVQYVVSEQQFFRQPHVRQAIATQGVYAAAAGPLTTIAWPGSDNGSYLVGEFTASDLVAMRT